MLMHGKLDMGHARALVGLDAAQQILMAEQIVYDGLSVREAESLVKKHHGEHEKPVAKTAQTDARKVNASQDVLRLQESLSDKLGAAVTIKAGANGAGSLKINYASLDQLDEIIAKISR
jgi:ParB family chromosome partitioning protein